MRGEGARNGSANPPSLPFPLPLELIVVVLTDYVRRPYRRPLRSSPDLCSSCVLDSPGYA